MEEEGEQLDYDEDVLEAAQKKAKELRPEVELVVGRQSSIQSSSLPSTTSGTNSIDTIHTNSAAPRPNFRYYVNPNFNKRRNLPYSNISNLPTSYGQTNRFRQAGSVYQNQHFYQPRHFLHANQMTAAFPVSHLHAPTSNFHQLGLPTIPTQLIPSAASGGNVYINRNAIATNNNSWDIMVDEFVRKNISARRRQHHYYSRSPSSSSSRSTSANSSTSRSHSASRSSSSSPNSRVRKDSSSRWKNSTKRATNKSNKSTSDTNRRHGRPTKSKNEQVNITHQTIECARAIGLDDEYLKKIEEQNCLREEIARRKSQHRRQEITAETKSVTTKLLDGEIEGPAQKRPKIQGPNGRAAAKEEKSANNNKLRPYLAVVVTNLRGVGLAEKKVNQLASTIGPVKKIWRDGADDCHVIFEHHEHAKQFMLQFHGKRDVLPKEEKEKATASPCIDITLMKVFLNLTSGGGSNEK